MSSRANEAIRLRDKLDLVQAHWSPKTVAALNDYHVKVVKLLGEFVWHSHDDTDELFLVLHGTLRIELRDRVVSLAAGDVWVVPRGVEHRPVAEEECHVLLIEPEDVVNTGDASGADARRLTSAAEWI